MNGWFAVELGSLKLEMVKGFFNFIEKALGRIDRLDLDGVHAVVDKLVREYRFLEILFDAIREGIIVIDDQGKISYYNRPAGSVLGFPDERLEGEKASKYLPEAIRKSLADINWLEQHNSIRFEVAIDYPFERFLQLTVVPLDAKSEGKSGFVLILDDVTEIRKKRIEAVAEERDQTLTLLAGSVAHEIGNPLHALQIHLQLVDREIDKLRSRIVLEDSLLVEGDQSLDRTATVGRHSSELIMEKIKKYVETAKGETSRLDYMVKQFLDAIRPAKPNLKFDDLNWVVRDTLKLLRPELENRGISVIDELCESTAKAFIDASQIRQILVNLIKNAMQAMTRNGQLNLKTSKENDGVWLVIEDTGIGIDKEKMKQIFEPHFTTKEKGSGLGLMIVYRIVEQHAGQIKVERGEKGGARFCIWLPRNPKGPRLLATN